MERECEAAKTASAGHLPRTVPYSLMTKFEPAYGQKILPLRRTDLSIRGYITGEAEVTPLYQYFGQGLSRR